MEGKGLRVWDQHGKEHIDAVAGGVWTVNVGYGRESIADAVRDQLVKLNFFGGTAGSIPGSIFSEMLIDKMPGMSRVYYASSGSEANEKGFKMVRQIAHKHEQDGAPDENYGVWAANEIEKVILREGPDTVGALCLEPVTAGGGVITPPDGYWERIREICDQYEILLHIDEVVCGVGRTGTWFGYQHYGIKPDMVSMAKGVASGYAAISCLVTTEAVFNMFKDDPSDVLNYFRDISTFGGCTAGPAAAIENMKIIERENLLENTTLMGAYMLDQLAALQDKHKNIGQVRGKGLFLGAELVTDRATKEPLPEKVVGAVVADCMQQGVIIGATNRSLPGKNNTLCFSPALICTKDDINQIIAAVDGALGRVLG